MVRARRCLLLAALLSLLGARADAGGERWRELARRSAWRVVLVEGVPVLLEPGFTHLAALTAQGKLRWRIGYQRQARGMQELFAVGRRALMWAGRSLLFVDPRSGKIAARREGPYLSGSTPDSKCYLDHQDGLCAIRCACRWQFIDCATGRDIGRRYDVITHCRRPLRGGHTSCGCWGADLDAIGRAGELLIAGIDRPRRPGLRWRGPKPPSGAGPARITVAVHRRKNKEVWRNPRLLAPASYIAGAGILPGGRVGWLADAFGVISAFDARSGRELWRHGKRGPHQPETRLAAVEKPPGVFRFGARGAELFDARTGKLRWRVPAAAGLSYAAPVEALPRERSLANLEPGRFVLLDARDGSPRAELRLAGPRAAVWRLSDHRFLVVDGQQLRLHDGAGQRLAARKLPKGARLALGDARIAVADDAAVRLYRRDTLAPAGRVRGRFKVIAMGGALGADRLLLHAWPHKHAASDVVLLGLAQGR